MFTSRPWALLWIGLAVIAEFGCSAAETQRMAVAVDVGLDAQTNTDAVSPPPDAAVLDGAADAALREFDTVRLANDRDYLPAALHLIDTAQTRIRMIEFVIYDDGSVATLLDHLIQAQGRGVEVMVLADEESGNTDRALARLAAAGVQTRLDSPQVTTHNKLLIADDNTLVGSHNLSSNALDRNTESSVWIRDTEVTAYYQEYFQALWADSATDPTLSWNGSDRIIPLKNRDVAGNLFRCIQGAQHQVRVVLYAMTYNRDFPGSDPIMLVDALVAAKARGVQVQVALDSSDWIRENAINATAMAVLLGGQVELRTTPRREVTHAKVVNCDDTLIIGDANWAFSSFSQYNGTSVRVTTPQTKAQFDTWFDAIWSRSDPID